MSAQGLSDELALCIGLAARDLPDIEPRRLVELLADVLGLPLTEAGLRGLSEQQLREAGEGALRDVSLPEMKRALDHLHGRSPSADAESVIPEPEPGDGEPLPGSIRVAVASNTGESVDGHFATCLRFLIYEVSAEAIRLVEVRRPEKAPAGIDKNVPRARLVADCDLIYVMSIGGPAAAQVVKRDIHPVKVPEGGPARDVLQRTQATLADNPPPWLAKAMAPTSI